MDCEALLVFSLTHLKSILHTAVRYLSKTNQVLALSFGFTCFLCSNFTSRNLSYGKTKSFDYCSFILCLEIGLYESSSVVFECCVSFPCKHFPFSINFGINCWYLQNSLLRFWLRCIESMDQVRKNLYLNIKSSNTWAQNIFPFI